MFSKIKSLLLLSILGFNLSGFASENNGASGARGYDSIYIDPTGKVDLEHVEKPRPKPVEWIDLTTPQSQGGDAKPKAPAAQGAKVGASAGNSQTGQTARTSQLKNDGSKTANTRQQGSAERGKMYHGPIDESQFTKSAPPAHPMDRAFAEMQAEQARAAAAQKQAAAEYTVEGAAKAIGSGAATAGAQQVGRTAGKMLLEEGGKKAVGEGTKKAAEIAASNSSTIIEVIKDWGPGVLGGIGAVVTANPVVACVAICEGAKKVKQGYKWLFPDKPVSPPTKPPVDNGPQANPEKQNTETSKEESEPKSKRRGYTEPDVDYSGGIIDDITKWGPIAVVAAHLIDDGEPAASTGAKATPAIAGPQLGNPSNKLGLRTSNTLRATNLRVRNLKQAAAPKPAMKQPALAVPSGDSQALSLNNGEIEAHPEVSARQQLNNTIKTISQDAKQIFAKYDNDVNIKAYHDATQRMCDAANTLNAQGRSHQAQAATDLAMATKEAGKVKINSGNQSAAFVSATEGKAEREGNALVVKALTYVSKLGDSVSRSMRSAWQNFKAQPNKDKAVALATTITAAVGVAYGAGVTPAIAIAYGQVIANELIAIGDKIGSMIPFSSAPLMSGLQKFFDAAPKCSHGLLARTAPHSTVSGPNLATRVWNGTSPLVQRLNLETWAMDSAAVQAEANAAAGVTQTTQGIFSIGSRLGKLSDKIMDEAVKYVMTDNKIRHIFEKSRHNLNFLVEKLGGREATVREILKAGQDKLPASGVFNDVPLEVSGSIVYVRGAVINGVPKLGTFFVK